VTQKRSDSTTSLINQQSHQPLYLKGFGGFFFDFAAEVRIKEYHNHIDFVNTFIE